MDENSCVCFYQAPQVTRKNERWQLLKRENSVKTMYAASRCITTKCGWSYYALCEHCNLHPIFLKNQNFSLLFQLASEICEKAEELRMQLSEASRTYAESLPCFLRGFTSFSVYTRIRSLQVCTETLDFGN